MLTRDSVIFDYVLTEVDKNGNCEYIATAKDRSSAIEIRDALNYIRAMRCKKNKVEKK
jgi:hypothetical protein